MQSRPTKYNLREKEPKSIFEKYQVAERDLHSDSEDGENQHKRGRRQKKVINHDDYEYDLGHQEEEEEDIFDNSEVLDKLPENREQLKELLAEVKDKLRNHKMQFLKEQQEFKCRQSFVGEHSVPICADITQFNFRHLIQNQLRASKKNYFDIIMMDPPWKLSTSQPSRGVAIQYDSLSDECIENIPIETLQGDCGIIAVWAINAKYMFAIKLIEKWGYKLVDSVTWVKKTVNGKIAKGHGFYLQHAKETCLIGVKGSPPLLKKSVARDVIFSDRRGQSQKPTEIYEYLQSLMPNGYYLEIFGRRNNLRDKWVTIGNEI